jgi:PleD family two-component response regulator
MRRMLIRCISFPSCFILTEACLLTVAVCVPRNRAEECVMNKGRILVVEDDSDISNLLRIYFDSHGYQVAIASKGNDALEACRRNLPNVIVLDIQLPDIDGYEVCQRLRSNLRTSHIPILFLTQRDERSDKIQGLELGADDYITKPFDIDEVKLRVQNALRRAQFENLTSPTTGLPSGKLIEEQLRALIRRSQWVVLYVGILHIDGFNEAYGFVAGDDVFRFAAMVLNAGIDTHGTANDFVGHVSGDDFIVITDAQHAPVIKEYIIERFNRESGAFYSFRDRERGYIHLKDRSGDERQIPLMKLVVGVVTPDIAPFADIRDITEIAAAERRRVAEGLLSIGRMPSGGRMPSA